MMTSDFDIPAYFLEMINRAEQPPSKTFQDPRRRSSNGQMAHGLPASVLDIRPVAFNRQYSRIDNIGLAAVRLVGWKPAPTDNTSRADRRRRRTGR